MDFKLSFNIIPPTRLLSLSDPLLMMGSCFAEEIGQRLHQHKVNVVVNPAGIQFNPISIFNTLQDCADEKVYQQEDIFEHQGLWHSWLHHGAFSNPDPELVLKKMNDSRQRATMLLGASSSIMLTLGSAHLYELRESGLPVANCHKLPQAKFHKRLLSVKEIISSFERLLQMPAYKHRNFIFTISPVRYIRDGLVENNHSKSILIRAVHELVEQHPNLYYFPAYEIVMDELRDYRFFKNDLVHPNELAIDYVWERFCATVFDSATKNVLPKIEAIVTAAKHKPLHKSSPAHTAFREATLAKLDELTSLYPALDFSRERRILGED